MPAVLTIQTTGGSVTVLTSVGAHTQLVASALLALESSTDLCGLHGDWRWYDQRKLDEARELIREQG